MVFIAQVSCIKTSSLCAIANHVRKLPEVGRREMFLACTDMVFSGGTEKAILPFGECAKQRRQVEN